MVGELPSRGEGPPPGVVPREDGTWLVDGLIDITALREALELPQLPDEEDGMYQTVGGLVTHMLGSSPTAGHAVTWRDWRFEVMDMDGRRVDKVLVSRRTYPDSRQGRETDGGSVS